MKPIILIIKTHKKTSNIDIIHINLQKYKGMLFLKINNGNKFWSVPNVLRYQKKIQISEHGPI